MFVKELIARLRQHPGDAEVLFEEGGTEGALRRTPLSRVLLSDSNNATGSPLVILRPAPSGVSRKDLPQGMSDDEYNEYLGTHCGGRGDD